jgi:Ca2+-binding RTX toxin-like protein
MATIVGTDEDDTIRTASAGGSLGGLPDATDEGDTIDGLAGNDLVGGGDGDDSIDAGDGDDWLEGGNGDDALHGGDGDDVLIGGPGADTHVGGDGDDLIVIERAADLPGDSLDGGPGGDMLLLVEEEAHYDLASVRLTGIERIEVGGGSRLRLSIGQLEGLGLLQSLRNDLPIVLDLADTGAVNLLGRLWLVAEVNGTPGDDVIAADASVIRGFAGDDVLTGGAFGVLLDGGEGNDILVGGPGFDVLVGGAGDDVLIGGEGANFLRGGPGADVHVGGGFFDVMQVFSPAELVGDSFDGGGGENALRLMGPGRFDLTGNRIVATEYLVLGGIDAVRIATAQLDAFTYVYDIAAEQRPSSIVLADAGPANLLGKLIDVHTVIGTDGDDVIGADVDALRGEAGDDVLIGGDGPNRLFGGAGDDTLQGGAGDDTLNGEAADDVIDGGPGDEVIRGGRGDDLLRGGEDRDRIQGGDGDDLIDGGEGDDVLLGQAGDDTILGNTGNDFIDGGAGDDLLDGGRGNDVIHGGGGDDIIIGGAGLDWLFGGAGADRFVLANRQADRDWINDFQPGEDLLVIGAAPFGAGLVPGALDPSRLVAGGNPVATAPGQFLYNTKTGALRWDADGPGGGSAQIVATLRGAVGLSAADFIIV